MMMTKLADSNAIYLNKSNLNVRCLIECGGLQITLIKYCAVEFESSKYFPFLYNVVTVNQQKVKSKYSDVNSTVQLLSAKENIVS